MELLPITAHVLRKGILVGSLTGVAAVSWADPIEWTNTVGGAWSLADNWSGGVIPDAINASVLFGPAIASAATVTLDGPRTVGEITFTNAAPYTLTGGTLTLSKTAGAALLQAGLGSHAIGSDISLASSVSAVTVSDASLALAGSLSGSSSVRLDKTGAGTLALSGPNRLFSGTLSASNGTLSLQAVTLPGQLSVAAPASVSVLPPSDNGLMGFYYNVAPTTTLFSTLAIMEAHLARMTPALAVLSSAAGTAFDFGSTGASFPLPYGLGGSRTNNFEAVWRGALTVPSSTYYTFQLTHDDGFLLALDRKMILKRDASGTTEGTVYLEAGPHEMVLGYYQGSGTCGLQVRVKPLYGDFALLPNAWLTPYTSVGALSGNGPVSLTASNAAFTVVQKNASGFGGELSGPAGSLFSKSDSFNLALTAAGTAPNAFAGDVAVQGGVLTLTTGERIGDASTVSLAGESGLRLAADETLGSLSGAGTVTLGNGPSVYVMTFSDDSNCGISTNKVYTHLLDFPADTGTPATVNSVLFTAAGLNGSANGYSWRTVNPPGGSWTNGFTTGIAQLLFDFAYGSTDYTLTLADLHPGQTYEARLYFKGNGDANSTRKVTFAFTAGAAFVGSVDYVIESAARSMVCCRYTADAAGTLAVHVLSHHSVDTCHLYGLSNEEASAPSRPEPAPVSSPCVVAFTNDADSGLSTLKTYTHKLDFPANGNPAVINGVVFTAAGMDGNADGFSWSTTGSPLNLTWNDPPNDSTRQGVDRLLWDFQYNSTNFTLTLSGLCPGQTYEARLYFRSFGNPSANSPRDATFTFTAGATVIGSVDHDLDTMARSMVRCRYTADAAGTLAIRVVAASSGYTCHLYGLSNELIQNTLPALTLDAPAGRTARHTGAITGCGTLVKRGAGTQALGGINSLTAPLDVQAGTLALESGASVLSGAVIRAGATLSAPNGNVWLGGLEGDGTFSLAGLPPYPVTNMLTMVFFSDDAGTGISTNKTYTHLLDFGQSNLTAVINGVAFTKTSSASGTTDSGYGWSNFPPISHLGSSSFGIPSSNGVYALLCDMNIGWSETNKPATMQLTGLIPGKRYEVHLFNRHWGSVVGGTRKQTLTFDPDDSGPISEAITFSADALEPNYIAYRYTAAGSTLSITILSWAFNQTLHLYGLSNEEVQDATYVPVNVNIERDSALAGPVTGAGGWVKTGAGTLTLSGEGTASGPLTVSAGAVGVTQGGCATTGTVSVAAGATLFGDGRVGGNVSVAGNASFHAGTPTACGTLDVGGSLTLSPDALLSYRFGAGGSNDTVTVNGLLTFPTSGVVEASAIIAGAIAPAKDVFLVSTQTINGPADLSGWTVTGVNGAFLTYSDDRKTIYFSCPRGTVFHLK